MELAASTAKSGTHHGRVDAVARAKEQHEKLVRKLEQKASARLPKLVATDSHGCVRLTDEGIDLHGMPVVMACLGEIMERAAIRPVRPRTMYDPGMVGLRALYLDGNELLSIPGSVGGLTSLVTLNLGFNILTVLPDSLCELSQLVTLSVNHNRIERLPGGMSKLSCLQYCYADHNFMSTPPEKALMGVKSLRTVWLPR
jgi:hypothetical protein